MTRGLKVWYQGLAGLKTRKLNSDFHHSPPSSPSGQEIWWHIITSITIGVDFIPFFGKPHAEASEEVHEEGSAEVLAHLIQDKPKIISAFNKHEIQYFSPISEFAFINESFNLVHFIGPFEVSVHPHVYHVARGVWRSLGHFWLH